MPAMTKSAMTKEALIFQDCKALRNLQRRGSELYAIEQLLVVAMGWFDFALFVIAWDAEKELSSHGKPAER